ncbi:putative 26S proteasome non-ATPase regulatory subunit [Gregarina niphandrodes]|uniref:26S proteasome non-ATPase regulatory subunit n=1 Tax=Gregarina niphandrodes TaxID=110365 RepID=A0A023AZ23_GRENI|nr:putative 26S proteasome non-ATPase regulatory subunit [Gregarina niphandrodes]EZG43881.1 putative 26S proteasome non-ATPase regulatory subunit [Gregarina niphandrodes]|eukprot:XP_011132939.1 putative 26S proteasome non-ATPase regulatory subunit [Gregarina niphandrodes]
MSGIPSSIRSLIGFGDNEAPFGDTSEQVTISSLALIKMLRHGRAGVPMEVMGLMLGEFVDEYTIRVVDVFSMPQSGNTVSVEAVDPVYQAEMLDMLKRTGRPEMVVGWYHSHPGFGCWFSGTDINTQQSFEQLNSRAVGVVVDSVQSVKGSVVLDCFRLINPHLLLLSPEPRQTTSNTGHCTKPTITALIHGLNKHYHSLVIDYKKSPLEQKILAGLMKPQWTDTLKLKSFTDHQQHTNKQVASIKSLLKLYKKEVEQDLKHSEEELMLQRVGKLHAKRQLQNVVDDMLQDTIAQSITATVSNTIY